MKTKSKKITCLITALAVVFMAPIMFLAVACGGGADEKEDKIQIYSSFKTSYYVGDSLDTSGGIITYKSDDGSKYVAIETNMVSGFNTLTAGVRDMVITYRGYTILISYSVKEYPATFRTDVVYKSSDPVDPAYNSHFMYIKFTSQSSFRSVITNTNEYLNINSENWNADYVNLFTFTSAIENDKYVLRGNYGYGTFILTINSSNSLSFYAEGVGTGGVHESLSATLIATVSKN